MRGLSTHFFVHAFACFCLLGNGNGEKASDHWAFQAVADPELPRVMDQTWIRNGIDSFILAKLERKGIPTPDRAIKSILERRLSFTLLGLPPSMLDPKDSLLEQLEELLASPHYGERWGRHWLDVVRYADSNGLDENAAHANAWRYRDYVVRSFNEDKPFDRFITEQVAGDLIPWNDDFSVRRSNLVATGFLSLGPKLLAEPDPVKLEMDMIDEQIDVIGRAFLGLTLGCARCHDHFFDPVSTEEYYALAGIFKSTRTMESFKRPAKWVENLLANSEEQQLSKKHQDLVEAQNAVVVAYRERANQELLASGKFNKLPKKPEAHYPEPTRKILENLEKTLKHFNGSSPQLDFAMGVQEGNVTELHVFVGGDPETRGEIQPRGFPAMFAAYEATNFHSGGSGRLELAAWLNSSRNPLTARVIVNRVWRWHFGRGIVETTDNFGLLGGKPTHPEMLDWLASRFIEEGWSIKALHRLILSSETWRMSSGPHSIASEKDPDNRLFSRSPVRRLEAELIRDSLLHLSGELDLALGGSTWSHENRKLVFNHTSEDNTNYVTNRRSIYLPVIRNNVYDLFQLFDFPNPNSMCGDRTPTTTPQQALYLMNSPLVRQAALGFSQKGFGSDPKVRIQLLYNSAFHRDAEPHEIRQSLRFLESFSSKSEPSDKWHAFAQSLICSNEFLYLE
ncbi:MAG: hypothetical protein CMI26_09855 [Opitutae bacterium]|nr:hypothetical protein [Opitutae bacterium]